MKRAAVWTMVGAMVLAGMAHCAEAPAVQRLLPGQGQVNRFDVMPKSLVYGKGNDLAKIYDGGYELYTKNGVVDAARQMYDRGGDYVEITVHTMNGARAAADFLAYWQREHKVKALTKTKTAASFTVTKPNVMAFLVVGRYFATVSAFYAADKALPDAKAFMAAISERASVDHENTKGTKARKKT